MLAAKRSAGVAPEVNLGVCVTHMPPSSANKAAHSGFETQRRHHQKSKTGYQWPHKKDMPFNNFFKTNSHKYKSKRTSSYGFCIHKYHSGYI